MRRPIASIILPTLDAAGYAEALIDALHAQTVQAIELIVMDSESRDGTAELFARSGARVHTVRREAFHHATARNQAADLAEGSVFVFLTQDSLPMRPDWLEKLIAPILQGEVAACFSRHVPRAGASPLERYARFTNYPETGRIVEPEDVHRLGVRAVFFSNSSSAIDSRVFEDLGGFPRNTVMNEDMLFAAKLLRAGLRFAYVSDSLVRHSHDYTVGETFRRYFDIGTVFAQAGSALPDIGVGRPGARYAEGLIRWLAATGVPQWIPAAILEAVAKGLGFQLGLRYAAMPRSIVARLSMHSAHWQSSEHDRSRRR